MGQDGEAGGVGILEAGIGQGLGVDVGNSLEELCFQSRVNGMVEAKDALLFSMHTFCCHDLGLCGIGRVHGMGSWIGRGQKGDMSWHGFEDGHGFGEDEVAVCAVSTVGVDGCSVGIDLSLEDEEGSMSWLTSDWHERWMRETGLE